MTSDAASSEPAVDLADQSVRPIDKVWTDASWATIVGSVDGLLRAYYGIHDFTEDPDCIFRTALCRARHPIGLCDGTQIRRGEIVGALHWWNEHLRRYSGHGPDIAWAGDMRRRIRRSLHLLADHIVRDPAWRPIEAFRADATLSSRLGSGQIRRVAERYGFEVVEPESSILLRAQALGASF